MYNKHKIALPCFYMTIFQAHDDAKHPSSLTLTPQNAPLFTEQQLHPLNTRKKFFFSAMLG